MHFSTLSLVSFVVVVSQESYGAVITKQRGTHGVEVSNSVGRRDAGSKYTLPQYAKGNASTTRAAAIAETQAGFLYGPALAGGPFYPAGPIGNATAQADLAALIAEFEPEAALAQNDAAAATEANTEGAYKGLKTLEDYTLLYDNEYLNTLPEGPAAGMLTNYTQDLLFSMERLSLSPYAVRRLLPFEDSLAFDVEDAVAQKVTGSTLQELFYSGRLFYVDHSSQGKLNHTSAYAPACDAYFFIDQTSGDFLPLAIRTGVGANLIYTPQDSPSDWLLAKIMYNTNDIYFTQFNHLAATHQVVQIVWMAAIRSLSVEHPVYALLDRLMYQVFGVQPIALAELFTEGEVVDQTFGYTGASAQQYTSDLYFAGKGRFQANYFLTDLRSRGLLDPILGPELKTFPFLEDATVVYNAINTFMTSFVDAYYASDLAVKADTEIATWATEANGEAEVMDFPASISSKETLVAVLTHMAHLVTTAHHAVNTNQLLTTSMVLPFHPAALWAPLPTTKGANTSVVNWLPPFAKCAAQLMASGYFARPLLVGTNRTLVHMVDDAEMLALMNEEVTAAAGVFKSTMEAFSEEVSARTFDAAGLSQGMPFVWKALDPNVAPYSITI